MSTTKLNAEELAAKRYSLASAFLNPSARTIFRADEFDERVEIKRNAYAAAIREVAQPIADERDELLAFARLVADEFPTVTTEQLEAVVSGRFTIPAITPRTARHIIAARAAIAKATGTNA